MFLAVELGTLEVVIWLLEVDFRTLGVNFLASESRFFKRVGVDCTLKNMTLGLYIRILAPGGDIYFKFSVFQYMAYLFILNLLIQVRWRILVYYIVFLSRVGGV